ncbi:MAG: hypothetical protein HXY40_11790, partial [Chloroflexi bacterium]|nr:hypothetical protein [Chloroflexota bacterium]
MKPGLRTLRMHPTLRALLLACLLLLLLLSFSSVFAAGTVTGVVFRDYNANGVRDAQEPGIGGIVINAFDSLGNNVGTQTTAADGSYTLNWGGTETTARIEFVAPAGFQSGAVGTQSSTSVQFVTNGGTADFSVNRSGDYCTTVPTLATNCFVKGDQLAGVNSGLDVLVSFPYDAGTTNVTSPAGADNPPDTTEATAAQIGTTWGIAYLPETNSIFAAAFMKRHTGFGPFGTGAIYVRNRSAGTVGLFVTIPNTGADPHNPLDYEFDALPGNPNAAWDGVGKLSLGDVDISDDSQFMYTVNLNDRRLYEVGINIAGGLPSAGAINSYTIPNPCPTAPPNNADIDFRPFGLGSRDGVVYIGVTCTAESSQVAANMSAHVFTYVQGSGVVSPAPVLSFALDYSRGFSIRDAPCPSARCTPAAWNPWTPVYREITSSTFTTPPFNEVVYPQPWLTDIEFDNNGDMVLGIRDRFGDQHGYQAPRPTGPATPLRSADTAGDVLRACATGTGTFLIENNAASQAGCANTFSSAGAGTNQGPGGGEFYRQDNYPLHDETFLGGLTIVPGLTDVVGTVYDPIFNVNEAFDGGIGWLSNTTGNRTRAYRLFDSDGVPAPAPTFGKGGGLGDLEALCPPQPIEIGNRVWFDTDQDGVQDPNETPLAGVIVQLRDPFGNVIASATTDANGNYYFSNAAGTSTSSAVYGIAGLLFRTTGYQVTIDLNQPPLAGLIPTQPDAGGGTQDTNDSDGILSGLSVLTTFGTGIPGANNHSYDFGFYPGVLPSPTAPGAGPGTGGGSGGGGGGPVVIVQPNPPFAGPGDPLTWTVTVSNPTNQPLTNVSFVKTESNQLEIVSVNSSGGTVRVNGQVITFTIDQLPANSSVTVTIVTNIRAGIAVPFIIENTAILQAPYSGRATGRVISATQLPATGVSPWWLLLAAA